MLQWALRIGRFRLFALAIAAALVRFQLFRGPLVYAVGDVQRVSRVRHETLLCWLEMAKEPGDKRDTLRVKYEGHKHDESQDSHHFEQGKGTTVRHIAPAP